MTLSAATEEFPVRQLDLQYCLDGTGLRDARWNLFLTARVEELRSCERSNMPETVCLSTKHQTFSVKEGSDRVPDA